MRFVIADDSRITRLILEGAIRRSEHELVAIATNGIEAVEQCRIHRPDVLICDISMPEMQGDLAAEQIISEGTTTHVFMGTSLTQDGVVGRLRDIGCVILSKPYDGDTVIARIELMLGST